MFEKAGRHYADWRDKDGKRKRKSFHSARAALAHEAAMREQAHPKKTTLGRPLPHYSTSKKPGGTPSKTAILAWPQGASGKQRATRPRTNSRARK